MSYRYGSALKSKQGAGELGYKFFQSPPHWSGTLGRSPCPTPHGRRYTAAVWLNAIPHEIANGRIKAARRAIRPAVGPGRRFRLLASVNNLNDALGALFTCGKKAICLSRSFSRPRLDLTGTDSLTFQAVP